MTSDELEEHAQRMADSEGDWRTRGVIYKYPPEYVNFPLCRVKVTLSDGTDFELPLIVERHSNCSDPKCHSCMIVEALMPDVDPFAQPIPIVRDR